MKRPILIIVLCVSLFSIQAFGLDFRTVTDQLEKTYDVEFAMLEFERLQKDINSLLNPEDYNFSLNPTLKAISQDDGVFGEELQLSGTASIKIPMGLSDIEEERLIFSLNSLDISKTAVETAKVKTFLKLYNLYQNTWLLQEEEPVLKLELQAAETNLEILQQRFEAGTVTLITLADANTTLQEKIEDYSMNLLRQKLAWYELIFTAKLDIEPEAVEEYTLDMQNLPKPPELSDWIKENHPLLVSEKVKVEQLELTIQRLLKPNIDISIKPFLNYDDHSASLSYSFSNPEISGAYSFPVYTYGEIPSSSNSSTSTWNTGVTVNISLGANQSDNLNVETLKLGLKSAEAKLDYLFESLNLQLRSSYQQLIKNQGGFDQSKRELLRSTENYKITETKKELGKASSFELLESEALVSRAKWKIESARINTESSWLTVLEAAAWFNKVNLDY